jgi:hypothetical protein
MTRSVAEGYIQVSEQTFKRLSPPELDKLTQAIQQLEREIRSVHAGTEDQQGTQLRARQLQRLRTAELVLRTYRMKFKR